MVDILVSLKMFLVKTLISQKSLEEFYYQEANRHLSCLLLFNQLLYKSTRNILHILVNKLWTDVLSEHQQINMYWHSLYIQ